MARAAHAAGSRGARRLDPAGTVVSPARSPASDERTRSIVLNELGDVAVAAGDLPGYEEGLVIAGKLAKANPISAEAQRDPSIDLERLGNVAIAAGDLSAPRHATRRAWSSRASEVCQGPPPRPIVTSASASLSSATSQLDCIAPGSCPYQALPMSSLGSPLIGFLLRHWSGLHDDSHARSSTTLLVALHPHHRSADPRAGARGV